VSSHRAIEVRWLKGSPKGFTDVFPVEEFKKEVEGAERLHVVRGPHGGVYYARFLLTVSDIIATLNYSEFSDFNDRHGMDIGIMELEFKDSSRRVAKSVRWKQRLLKSQDALAIADDYLPRTEAIEGRAGKPRAHRYYRVKDVPAWAESPAKDAVDAARRAGEKPGPFTKHIRHEDTKEQLFDLIGTGGQVVAPPSLHPSEERREWERGCDITKAAVLTWEELWEHIKRFGQAIGAKMPNVGPDMQDEPEVGESHQPDAAAEPAGPTLGAGSLLDLPPIDERVRRCRPFLATVELARSGHGGHDATFRAARIIVNDYGVTDREAALSLMREYNDSLKSDDRWTEANMAYKIDSAINARPDPKYPFGCKLFFDGNRAWNDPTKLARAFLQQSIVKFVKKTAFDYQDGTYQTVSGEWLEAKVRVFIEAAALQESTARWKALEVEKTKLRNKLAVVPVEGDDAEDAARKAVRKELAKLEKIPKIVPVVDNELVRDTLGAIKAHAQLADRTELDSWLDGRTAPVLGVKNGLLDPRGRTLIAHSPKWFATAKLPVAYDPTATEPTKWLEVLNDLLEGDAHRIAVIQEVFGACLDRGIQLKWFAAFVGSGDNGKSVVLTVLRLLLGSENCSAVNLDELTTNRFALFSLFGKLANLVGDQGHFESRDEGRLKTLTGGDQVTYEQKGKDPFTAINRSKLIFACNTMPTFADKSEAVWNRLVALPFEYVVPAGKKNPAMLTESFWADELPGVLNWALDGLARLHKQGRFTHSARCEALKQQNRLDSNPARLFLSEEYEYTGHDDKIPVNDLYQSYKTWCDQSKVKNPLMKSRFGREVPAVFPQLRGSETRRNGQETARYWVGIRRVTDVTTPPIQS